MFPPVFKHSTLITTQESDLVLEFWQAGRIRRMVEIAMALSMAAWFHRFGRHLRDQQSRPPRRRRGKMQKTRFLASFTTCPSIVAVAWPLARQADELVKNTNFINIVQNKN